MWSRHEQRNDQGSTAMEYVAMLLVVALFVGTIAIGIKPEWVRYKVCQAIVAVSGEGSCSPVDPSKPLAQRPPKPCVTQVDADSTIFHADGKIRWVKLGGEAAYGYRFSEYSDGSADVELHYSLKGEGGVGAAFGGEKGGVDASVALSAKDQMGEAFHYDTVGAARAAEDRLKQYARDEALSKIRLAHEPEMDGTQRASTSNTVELGLHGHASGGINPDGYASKSTDVDADLDLDGNVSHTTTHDAKTGNMTEKIETLGSLKGSVQANAPVGGSGTNASVGGRLQRDAKISVAVTKDRSGNIIELIITRRDWGGGSSFVVDAKKGGTGRGKYRPERSDEHAKDLSDRNYKPRRAAQNKPDPSLSGKVGGSGEDRSTTTYRLAVNDQNRARVTAWLGGDEIGRDPVQISELLLKSARIDPLDINKNDDFAKFLHDSQDAQIDTQTTTEVSGSTDNSLNLKIASGGIKDDLKSSSSTGQIYFPLENGQRVARKAVGCK